jgi:hypothetical protein
MVVIGDLFLGYFLLKILNMLIIRKKPKPFLALV